MRPRTEIINNRVVNSIEQFAGYLHPGDIFRKMNSKTQYTFNELRLESQEVVCENMDTHLLEVIFYHSPVFKLVII